MHRNFGGDKTRTADPNFPKGYYIPYGFILNNNPRWFADGGCTTRRHCSSNGKQLYCASLVFYILFIIIIIIIIIPSFSAPLYCLYLHP